jgi:hypothetical protein
VPFFRERRIAPARSDSELRGVQGSDACLVEDHLVAAGPLACQRAAQHARVFPQADRVVQREAAVGDMRMRLAVTLGNRFTSGLEPAAAELGSFPKNADPGETTAHRASSGAATAARLTEVLQRVVVAASVERHLMPASPGHPKPETSSVWCQRRQPSRLRVPLTLMRARPVRSASVGA